MRIGGGIIGLIAGIFGFIAAIATLFIGGVTAAFEAPDGGLFIALGWGGVLFSSLIIIFSSVAIGLKKRWPGIAMALSSLFGAVFGGPFVAILMVLSLIGGVLVFFGAPKRVSSDVASDLESPQSTPANEL